MELANDFLNTPIKKIQALSIHSPDIKQIMVDKGYSNSISDKVINELNLKLNDISNLPPHNDDKFMDVEAMHTDHFDKIHNNHFDKMESIMNHYSIKRNTLELNNTKKKRRTLTGVEESPVLLNSAFGRLTAPKLSSNIPIISPTRKGNGLLSSPINTSSNSNFLSSPNRVQNGDSPNRVSPSRISPSRGSYNLNGILNRKMSVPKSRQPSPTRDFKLPKAFTKIDSSNTQNKPPIPHLSDKTIPVLQKKSSIPTLQKKSSIPTLQKKPSIPTLQKKPSTPTLQQKPPVPTLQSKPSISAFNTQLHNKPSIPTINKKPSIPTLSKKSSIPTLQKKPSTSFSSTSISSISSTPHFNYVSNPTTHINDSNIYFKHSSESSSSLTGYARPTISSSQKSLDRFTRFKNKFH